MTLPPVLADAAVEAPRPEAARLFFERLVGTEGPDPRLDEPGLARTVALVVSASRALGRLLLADPDALGVLAEAGLDEGGRRELVRPDLGEDGPQVARRKRLGLLRIAARDLLGVDDLETVGAALSDLADSVLFAATSLAGASEALAVVAMGKHGARELNYASDVDVVLVAADAEGAGQARRLLALAGEAFRVDTDLRPEGRSGALVRSLDSYRAYWDRWARPWEFQALLKARFAAGNAELGTQFEQAAAEALWSRRLDADDLSELRAMKGRAEQIVSNRGLSGREIKRGRGGIRDIEFAVQLLQLVHGGADPGIRLPATLPALAELARAGYVDGGDAAALSLAYRFLRIVEHRLQLVEEAQVHTVPADPDARRSLAAVLGLARGDGTRPRPTLRFDTVLAHYQSSARTVHERLFFRPLLEAFLGAETGPPAFFEAGALDERLAAFGFRSAERTKQALSELTRGLTRSSRLMQQMLPVLLGWLSESPDPDQGLLALRSFASVPHRRDVLVAGFRDSPELARRLCLVVGTGRQVSELAGRNPDMALRIGDDTELRPLGLDELSRRAAQAPGRDVARASRSLRSLVESETLRIAAADVLEKSSAAATSKALAALADAVMTAALTFVAPKLPMALVALGRLGGEELSYGSDLDVLVAYEGRGPADAAEAERAAGQLFGLMNGATPVERILTVDASLRPEGRKGPLARSLDAYAEYYDRWALTWERQSLLRARPLAGDPAVLRRFMDVVDEAVWARSFGAEEVRETRRMKARVERERIPTGEDPQFHLKLGKGSLSDVEWTAQLLQLEHRVRSANTLEALSRLASAGHLSQGEAAVLQDAYTFLDRTRNRWHLVGNFVAGAGGVISKVGPDSLPQSRDALGRLARSLGTTGTDLREAYRRVTRRARRVTEVRFFGLE